MPSELFSALFKRRSNVDAAAETWESAPSESTADAAASHLEGIKLDAPSAQEWLRRLGEMPEEDPLMEALAETLKERGELPEHAPRESSAKDDAKLKDLADALAKVQAKFAEEREKLGGAREELAKREAEIKAREEGLEAERIRRRELEESQRNYPAPEWLHRESLVGTINIGVVGNAGVGKSLLINRLRKIRPHANGWAPVGVNETTMEPTMYTFKNMEKVRLWDLPGAGTEAFPSETYVRTMGLRHFDKVIIVTAGRFTSTEVTLRAELETHQVPFFMVRTKVDIDVYNNQQDNGLDMMATVRQITDDLRNERGVEKPFLVSLRDPEGFDWNALMNDLIPNLQKMLDPHAPSFEPGAQGWNEPWALPVAFSAALTGLQGRWMDGYGAMYLIQGIEAHVTLASGQNAIVGLGEAADGKIWWTDRWFVDRAAVDKARVSRELRWTPSNVRQDKPLNWWWSD